jgi:hypothetical protein
LQYRSHLFFFSAISIQQSARERNKAIFSLKKSPFLLIITKRFNGILIGGAHRWIERAHRAA